METFSCSCITLNCKCQERFVENSTNQSPKTQTSMTTITTESYFCGERVTEKNTIKVIMSKINSRQRKKDIRNAMKEKRKLKIKLH